MDQPRRQRRRLVAAGAALGAAALLPGCTTPVLPARPIDPKRAPRVGDTWRYAYNGGWNNVPNRQLEIRCVQVGNSILDRLSLLGDSAGDERVFTGAWEMVVRPLVSGFALTELSPYLDAFDSAVVGLASGVSTTSPQFGPSWAASARATGTETLQTPAGGFEAVRVDFSANRPFLRGMDSASDPVYWVASAWYAPRARRVVRFTQQSFAQMNNPLVRDSYELLALTLK
jgi:hypothetical protein